MLRPEIEERDEVEVATGHKLSLEAQQKKVAKGLQNALQKLWKLEKLNQKLPFEIYLKK
jgi:hypothetical protein